VVSVDRAASTVIDLDDEALDVLSPLLDAGKLDAAEAFVRRLQQSQRRRAVALAIEQLTGRRARAVVDRG
jgi:hypothetical protein